MQDTTETAISSSSVRSLQQTVAAKQVSSAQELLTAVASGAKDIRITDHIDLTGLPGFGIIDQGVILTWKLRSIRVRTAS
jgi:hypothetical protein